jgi:hypothetical protein
MIRNKIVMATSINCLIAKILRLQPLSFRYPSQ